MAYFSFFNARIVFASEMLTKYAYLIVGTGYLLIQIRICVNESAFFSSCDWKVLTL